MYRQDLSVYSSSNIEEKGAELVSVGWLDGAVAFPVGRVPQAVLDRVKYLCVFDRIAITRGFHLCDIGQCAGLPPYPPPMASIDGREAILGSSEIRVAAPGGKLVYAAPNLIVHYMEEHGYLPPKEFLDAIGPPQDS
jgi:hypothetical protein